MTDVNDYMTMLKESQLKRTIVIKDVDKIILENKKLKELLKECRRQFEEVELCRYDIADTDQEDWLKISTEQANIANKMITKIDEVLK